VDRTCAFCRRPIAGKGFVAGTSARAARFCSAGSFVAWDMLDELAACGVVPVPYPDDEAFAPAAAPIRRAA
jgi:hypothetical protein